MSGMNVLGLGHDVVDVAAFAEQLALPGSRMKELFSVRELRQAMARAKTKHDGETVHLAAKWAGKEAVLKSWEQALGDNPSPYTLDNFPLRGIEILDDGRGRPQVVLTADVSRALHDGLPFASMSVHPMPDCGAASRMSFGTASDQSFSADIPDRRGGGPMLTFRISLSHDGPIASAMVMLCAG